MSQSTQIAKRFREVLLDGTWIANTNFQKQLATVTWKQATTEISSLNTIAILTLHVNYYIEGLVNVFKGGELEIKDKYSFDFPPIQSEKEWKETLLLLWENAEEFASLVESMPDEKMDEVFVKKEYGTYHRNINAIIEHSYYHLGQISLIKKML